MIGRSTNSDELRTNAIRLRNETRKYGAATSSLLRFNRLHCPPSNTSIAVMGAEQLRSAVNVGAASRHERRLHKKKKQPSGHDRAVRMQQSRKGRRAEQRLQVISSREAHGNRGCFPGVELNRRASCLKKLKGSSSAEEVVGSATGNRTRVLRLRISRPNP